MLEEAKRLSGEYINDERPTNLKELEETMNATFLSKVSIEAGNTSGVNCSIM